VDQLIIRVLQGDASSQETEQLQALRRAARHNERRYQEVASIWRATEVDRQHAARPRPQAAEIVSAAESPRHDRSNRSWPWFRQVAAVAAALVLGLLLGEFRLGTHSEVGPALQAAEFVTGPTELATAQLSDGTVVRLAPSTRLRVGDGTGRREVWLDGKAFFAVAADERAPFTVRTRAGEALVLGTRFEVDVTAEDLQVLVVEGKVEVGDTNHRVEVQAGQVSRGGMGSSREVSPAGDVTARLDWMGHFLAFERTPLHRVALEIESRYGMRVHIADDRLAQRTVTAWFGDEEPEAVLRVICRIADAHCSIRDGIASIEP